MQYLSRLRLQERQYIFSISTVPARDTFEKTFYLKISDALKKAAAACVVRECDEERPGRFVAYVDEDDDSWDVTLELDAGRQPATGSCDCGNKKPCRHIAALFLFVDKGAPVAAPAIVPVKSGPKKSKAKSSAAEPLLEQVSPQELAAWLLEVFASNKDLELAFVNRFGGTKELTPAAIQQMSGDAVKTVMGRKRIPDATQITKLLQLWKDLFRPVARQYEAAPASREAFEALAAAVNAVMDFAHSHSGTGKLQKYARQLLSGFAAQVSLLKQDEAFYQAAGFALTSLLRQPFYSRPATIDYLRALSGLLSGPRLSWFAENLGTQFLLHRNGRSLEGDASYRQLVLEVLVKAGVFAGYADAFSTLSWNPDFNIPLITAWINAGMYELAERAAWQEIQRNTKEMHNPPYYKLVQQIYTASGNQEGLLKLLRLRLPQTFEFDDYLLALQSIADPAEKREFRNKMYTSARNVKSEAAKRFVLALTVQEGNWGRLLEMIAKDELGYAAVSRHFDALYNFESKELIRALMQRRDWDAMYNRDQPDVFESVERVVQQVLGAYDHSALQLLLTRYSIGYQHSTAMNLFRPRILAALKEGRESEAPQ